MISLVSFALAALQPSSSTPPLTDADRSAAFRAAGFVLRGREWRTPECAGMEGASYSPGTIDRHEDLNGDGRPEVILSEGSAICYGMTGTRFWLLSRQPGGPWKVMTSEVAMPEFLATRGAGGWPDVSLGGPGFCFPVHRWDGRAYDLHRFEYEGKRCTPPRP